MAINFVLYWRRVFSIRDLGSERGCFEEVDVVCATRCAKKRMPNPERLVRYCFESNGSIPFLPLILTVPSGGAIFPDPFATVNASKYPWKSSGFWVCGYPFDVMCIRGPKICNSKAIIDSPNEVLKAFIRCGCPDSDVFIYRIRRAAICENTNCGGCFLETCETLFPSTVLALKYGSWLTMLWMMARNLGRHSL